MMFDTQTSPQRPRSRIRDDYAYMIPMAVFLLFTQAGAWWPKLFIESYVAKTLVVPVLLWAFWNSYTKIRWTHAMLGVVVGVIGLVQWVGMEKILLHFFPTYPRFSVEVFDPTKAIASDWARYWFIAIRWAGASLVVPVMEELFWRDYAWRTIIAPNDFKLAEVGEWDPSAFFLVPLIFAAVHVQWLTAIVWALMIGLLLVKTKSLGACIIAHGVTNFLLGAYVLCTKDWYFW
jgi:CAAX prenyl protease-like protein